MIWVLVVFSAIYGWAAALAVRRFSNTARVRAAIRHIVAHMMELQLFLESPSIILRAQRDLIRENLRLLRLVAPASLIPAAIFALLYPQLDTMFGFSPLRVWEQTTITARVDDARLEAPAGFQVETPAVRDVHDHVVSWRVRPFGRASGNLNVRLPDGRLITRRIVAGSGFMEGWSFPLTAPAIDIRYPRRDFIGLSWLLWFFGISAIAGAIGWKQ